MNQQNKRMAAFIIIFAILLLVGVQQMKPEESAAILIHENASEKPENSFSQPETIANEIVVHVAGAVKNPGVYTLIEGARIEDALQKAGLDEEADADALNRAAVLSDGQKIVVPSIADMHTINQQEDVEPDINSADQNAKINLNQATILQLMELPGIGEVKANAILQYRKEHGSFQSVDELLMVNGIGNAIYEQIADRVTV